VRFGGKTPFSYPFGNIKLLPETTRTDNNPTGNVMGKDTTLYREFPTLNTYSMIIGALKKLSFRQGALSKTSSTGKEVFTQSSLKTFLRGST
jgi:hypothetical protein